MTKSRDLANAATALNAVTAAELGYVDGVTSAIQTQLDAKLASSTAATTYQAINANVSTTELGYLDGVTSAIQTQLDQKSEVMAGKNCVINGGMDIFQRGSFTTNAAYALDRWYITGGANQTVTQSTAKTTPNSQYMMLMTASTTQQIFCYHAIETKNAIYYAGKTATLSAYAAGLTTTTNYIMILQYSTSVDVGMGGTWTDITATGGNPNLTLSSTVTRWSATYAIPSTAKSLRLLFVNNAENLTVGQGVYLGDVQLEVGSVATAFSRAGGTIQGELAACQRYYWRNTSFQASGGTQSAADNNVWFPVNTFNAVPMRTTPTAAIESNPYIADFASNLRDITSVNVTSKSIVGFAYSSTKLTTSLSFGVNFADTGRALSFSSEL